MLQRVVSDCNNVCFLFVFIRSGFCHKTKTGRPAHGAESGLLWDSGVCLGKFASGHVPAGFRQTRSLLFAPNVCVVRVFQIPNPLFDLAGITCGHFLVPFWTFFGATLIGKAIIKMHIQVGISAQSVITGGWKWAWNHTGGVTGFPVKAQPAHFRCAASWLSVWLIFCFIWSQFMSHNLRRECHADWFALNKTHNTTS